MWVMGRLVVCCQSSGAKESPVNQLLQGAWVRGLVWLLVWSFVCVTDDRGGGSSLFRHQSA